MSGGSETESFTPEAGHTPPTVQLASLPRQWRAEAKSSDPAYGNGLRDCARELAAVLSISPRGCWEHPGVMGYQHPECGFCWHGKDGLDVPVEGRGANREPRCPRCALDQAETAARADERERIAREFERVADGLLAERSRLSDRILHPAMAEIYRHCAEIARATTEVPGDG